MKKITALLFLFIGLLQQPHAFAISRVENHQQVTDTSKLTRLKQIAAQHPDGFTVYTTTLKSVKRGWCVGLLVTQNSFGDAGLRKALKIAQATTKIIGGWKNCKLFYWDAVMIYYNEKEAIKAGIKNKQLAIYNIETGRTVKLKVVH